MTRQLDLLVQGGRVVDGTGGPSRLGSIGVKDGMIVSVRSEEAEADVVLDATGYIVSPGFIDAHSNLSWGLFLDPTCRILVYQGITTGITGNCGGSVFPREGGAAGWIRKAGQDYGVEASWRGLQEYKTSLGLLAIDIIPLVGHGTLRAATIGFASRSLNSDELDHLRSLVRRSLKEGAWGLSFGLAYSPGVFADQRELMACCEEAAAMQRLCCFHLRIESDQLEEAVAEVIRLAEGSGARCVICHHKALGRGNWGKTEWTVAMVNEASNRGCEIFFDMYPYTTALRNLAMLLPDWAHESGRECLVQRLGDPQLIPNLVLGLRENVQRWDAAWEDTIIWNAPSTPEIEGVRASEVIAERGEEGLLDILLRNEGRVLTLYEGASGDDLERVARHPGTFVGSDGNAQYTEDAGHPRSFATFPRFLGEFVFRRQVLSIEEAVWKMTGLPAQVFGLTDRGFIREGLKADLCVFSLEMAEKVADTKTSLPFPWPRHLIVGGQVIIQDGRPTGKLPGCVVLANL